MLNIKSAIPFLFIAVCTACSAAAPAPPEWRWIAPPPVPRLPAEVVWTARADVPLRTDTAEVALPRAFSRLDVLGIDAAGLRVRCSGCDDPVEGWVAEHDVVFASADMSIPAAVANADLVDFLSALRSAAERHDIAALQAVMHSDFTFSFGARGGPLEAAAAWQAQDYRPLDHLTAVLDRGVVITDEGIWVAPPEFATGSRYDGIRTGFRRTNERWVWLFFVGKGLGT